MNMRVTGSYPAGLTSPVDKRIGDAFPIIEEVYKHLKQLKYLAENSEKFVDKQVEFRANTGLGAIEWHYSDQSEWLVLVSYDELTGVDFSSLEETLNQIIDNGVQTLTDNFIEGMTQYKGNIEAGAEWVPVPSHADDQFDAQALALTQRTELLKQRTELLKQRTDILEQQGVSDWTVGAQPYPINALVRHTDKVWLSLVANNNVTPTEGASWTEVGALASETVAGIVEIATAAEAQALTDDTTALTPAKLAAAFGGANQMLTANGYQKLPNGLIIQWGGILVTGLAGNTFNYPVAFPNDFFSLVGIIDNISSTTLFVTGFSTAIPKIKGAFRVNTGDTVYVRWFAIGY